MEKALPVATPPPQGQRGWPKTAKLPLGRPRYRVEDGCKQPDAIFPTKNTELDRIYEYLSSDGFRNETIERLSGAVKVKTESFDDLGPVGEDARWEVFYDFHAYLKDTFPLIHAKLAVDKINTHGLLYTWKGSDGSLKPTLLMAHQDTVPVPAETVGSWTHPPFSGAYDGRYIWGRGSSDCKNQLIATMEAVELLLQAGFEPKRTLLLSFGFDEECGGQQGASSLSSAIQKRYGDDSVAVIVDEGATFERAWGVLFAKPGTAEKGYTDVKITVRMPGGHSSIPPQHTSIGVLSELIVRLEDGQYRTHLEDENPYYTQLQCGAAHSPDFPSKLKKLLSKRLSSPSRSTCKAKPDYLALEAAKQGPEIRYLMQTSQAVDVVGGGVKINALPERASATVNHRINIGDTRDLVYNRLAGIATGIAHRHNLTLHAFDGGEGPASITLEASRIEVPPSPVTPADGRPYAVLAGTVRALYGGDGVVVAPGIMTGNTDTRYYWALTRHIFRFGPGYDADEGTGLENIHTVNEKISVASHVNTVKWLMLFLRNMDEAEL
ncbi:hypothetical protein B0T26DRAFT_741486 [Lasiosphaeria miniovina]|uniref:Peptidase M20 dimerisation domain-containing protein n=1 Tax=Lasiosphaeria miniovina TaxID=1954250 RepID=A0AA40AMJ2_9PEZI|nr:uncharacterized protein B0T26DRAFT_741486 [Lasiosphaeria miniovina]KAK0718588.1 hypothetical protein B0T26DRAFT_741486 [Lasiosphaeria miniovina]